MEPGPVVLLLDLWVPALPPPPPWADDLLARVRTCPLANNCRRWEESRSAPAYVISRLLPLANAAFTSAGVSWNGNLLPRLRTMRSISSIVVQHSWKARWLPG
eukprot:scaffold2991_cov403-Prasinococcus_capsulatus_cf.AAC.12